MSIKFGLDMGQSSLKGVGEKGSVQFPSLAALIGNGADTSVGKKKKHPMVVSNQTFGELYVGRNAHRWGVPMENFDFARLAGATPEMRAIFYGAMTEYQRKYGRFEEPLEVVVGLPMQMLGNDENGKRYEHQVKGWLGGEHHWLADGEGFEAIITSVKLAPQSLGAVVDYSFDMDGNSISAERNKALTQECATMWIGSNTVELQVTKRDEDTKRFNGGAAIGVRWLHNQVDPNGLYTFGEFDESLRTHDLPDGMDIERFLGPWATEIFGFTNRKWGQAHQRFYRIFVGGGGSILLRDHLLSQFNGKVIFPGDPIMSIAQGLYKAALRSK
jgi:hypothetical protein